MRPIGHGLAATPASRAGVRVWRIDLTDPGQDVEDAARCLTLEELQRADRGTPAVRRRRILVRSALRRLLGERLGIPPGQVPLVSDRGRPVLEGAGKRLQVSCSASVDIALIGISSSAALGVDVQHIEDEDVASATAEGWLSDWERARIERLPGADHPGALTRAWVQKEAVLKGEGTGLLRAPVTVRTPVADRGRVGRWALQPLPVPGRAVACLALRQPLLRRGTWSRPVVPEVIR